MTSFFNVGALGGNPFSTPIGQRIEQATDGSLASEDWALNMEICDMINESSDIARDAMKAIRKRLTQNAGKNNQVIIYTLIVVETCVKNCGKAFHILVANKEFIQELIKLIGPKNDPPAFVQEKVLSLIQVWADAFKSQPDLNGVVQLYHELKNKGIEFPSTDLEGMAPIFTPERSVPEPTPVVHPTISPQHAGQVVNTARNPNGSATAMNSDQTSKIQSELEIVSINMSILGEMLNELKPGQEDTDEYKLLTELTQTCKEMQGRIVELIGRVNNDEVTAELLRLNDELNNLFLRHQRYEKNRDPTLSAAQAAPSAILGAALGVPPPKVIKDKDTLIDLSDEATGGAEAITTQFSGLEIGTASSQLSKLDGVNASKGATKHDADEFDMLAQSRNLVGEGNKSNNFKDIPSVDANAGSIGSPYKKPVDGVPAKDSEFDEMAAWLTSSTDNEGPGETLTSTEFDKFLAERAAAADNLPTVSTTTTDTSKSNRQQNKTKKEEDNLLL